jgi:hypothetical protein
MPYRESQPERELQAGAPRAGSAVVIAVAAAMPSLPPAPM